MTLPLYLECWGKGRPDEGSLASWHPAAYHCLDVAACVQAILDARPVARARAARVLSLPEKDAVDLIVALAALHDVGKFADGFQAMEPAKWPPHYGPYPEASQRRPHTQCGLAVWRERLRDEVGELLVPADPHALMPLMMAVFGHHGRPLHTDFGGALSHLFSDPAADAASGFVRDVSLWLFHPVTLREDVGEAASWWLNGLFSIADWIGSNQAWFPYRSPTMRLDEYWEQATRLAAVAVRFAGLRPPAAARPRTFAELTSLPYTPSPGQQWALDVPLCGEPTLFLLEDLTGSGKTEAAHVLVHRLMADARATGAYWAMPTQATANSMYDRQARMIRALFAGDDGVVPSLILAHGQSRLHEGFRSTVLGAPNAPLDEILIEGTGPDDTTDSATACASFLSDDRRASLLADIGAGTIDQAILAILPSKFNTIRLFALAEKVLVLDEVHGYDAYMFRELRALVRFQAALGGSVVILSATLPQAMRRQLLEEWSGAVRRVGEPRGRQLPSTTTDDERLAYPLASWLGGDGQYHTSVVRASSARRVDVRFAHDIIAVVDDVERAARADAAVVWVRNTVNSCLDAAALLADRGLEPVVFHARFAQCDRQSRERDVLTLFGKTAGANRCGRVLVATQVVEQSLDLDFDLLISDLAPVDLLIQRAGRLWRHPGRDRRGVTQPEIVVVAPEFTDSPNAKWLDSLLPGTSAVYENPGVLWRTLRVLADRRAIVSPGEIRELVESVYGANVIEDYPSSLEAKTSKAIGNAGAKRSMAESFVLKLGDGWVADFQPNWYSDVRVPTRLSDEQTVIRLARVGRDGGVVPWAQGHVEDWRSWALSEVRVSQKAVRPLATAAEVYRDRVDAIRSRWPVYEREVAVAVMKEREGAWEGRLCNADGAEAVLAYREREGLRIS